MRTARVLFVVGAALSALGMAAACWIGPDDWLERAPVIANPGGEHVVVTDYALLSFRTPIRITASADGGEVFLGVAHAIDADDYLGHVTARRVTYLDPFGLTTVARPGTTPTLPVRPQGLDLWEDAVTGPGHQSLQGLFWERPVQVVVTTATDDARPLRISIANQTPGGFAICCGVTAAGAAVIASALLLRRRRVRKPVVEPSLRVRDRTRSWPALATVAALLATAGCVDLPVHQALPERAGLTKASLTREEATELAASYDQRNNAALTAAAAPGYSTKAWHNADTALILDEDLFTTESDHLAKSTRKPDFPVTGIESVFATPITAYPAIAVTSGTFETEPITAGTDRRLTLFRREHSYLPWLQVAAAPLTLSQVPTPASALVAPDTAAALRLAEALRETLQSGRAGSVALPAGLRKERTDHNSRSKERTESWSVALLSEHLACVTTAVGTLTVASFVVRVKLIAREGWVWSWQAPYDKLYDQVGDRSELDYSMGLIAVVATVQDRAEVIAWRMTDRLSQ